MEAVHSNTTKAWRIVLYVDSSCSTIVIIYRYIFKTVKKELRASKPRNIDKIECAAVYLKLYVEYWSFLMDVWIVYSAGGNPVYNDRKRPKLLALWHYR